MNLAAKTIPLPYPALPLLIDDECNGDVSPVISTSDPAVLRIAPTGGEARVVASLKDFPFTHFRSSALTPISRSRLVRSLRVMNRSSRKCMRKG